VTWIPSAAAAIANSAFLSSGEHAERRVCIQRDVSACGADAAQNNHSGAAEGMGLSNTASTTRPAGSTAGQT